MNVQCAPLSGSVLRPPLNTTQEPPRRLRLLDVLEGRACPLPTLAPRADPVTHESDYDDSDSDDDVCILTLPPRPVDPRVAALPRTRIPSPDTRNHEAGDALRRAMDDALDAPRTIRAETPASIPAEADMEEAGFVFDFEALPEWDAAPEPPPSLAAWLDSD